jgi:hypothetical protein
MAKGTKTGGRKKGIPNKVTHAFDQVGGVEYLTMVARTHPQVFCALLGKVLPTQITGADGDPKNRSFTRRFRISR